MRKRKGTDSQTCGVIGSCRMSLLRMRAASCTEQGGIASQRARRRGTDEGIAALTELPAGIPDILLYSDA